MYTISISFLNHILFPNVTDYHLRFRLLEESHRFPLSNDIEFHILELPKFKKTLAELQTGLDKWLYFFRHAATMDTEAIPEILRQPLLLRAVEELKMLAQTAEERERYEARRKWQLDYNTGIKVARMEGLAAGRTEEKIGIIHFLEQLLQRPETPTAYLASLSLEDLARLTSALQDEVRQHR